MTITPTSLPDVLLIEPRVFDDSRGSFFESYNLKALDAAANRQIRFVQDNHSTSVRRVLRGLHYQLGRPQGKLVRVVTGEIFDVAVDFRRGSPTFGRWTGTVLSAENRKQVWIPEGFAHGFLVLSDAAEVIYKTTDYYAPECERTVRWDDPTLAIGWPAGDPPILSPRDAAGLPFSEAEYFA